ncbi:MAG: hypothetical protein JF625_01950 [Inquilinus limosus]|uniref:ABC-type glycine betaine transport system substrate-binding domain-containing protein n=1 Tax=Inquilinus limosus TaxID=171674 RepID=A0A952KIN7_9PROT|nr:hypothetical protein [Inquilinus limosus]
MMNARRFLFAAAAIAALAPAGGALADDAACKTVKLSDVGWTDITSTTALAQTVLTGLGYEPKVDMLSVAVTFESLKNNQVNLFLGNWMPSQTEMVDPYLKQGVELVGTNLADAKVTLAVNREAYEAGVKDFADLQKFADKFGKSIYSIEPGSSANKNLSTIIEKNELRRRHGAHFGQPEMDRGLPEPAEIRQAAGVRPEHREPDDVDDPGRRPGAERRRPEMADRQPRAADQVARRRHHHRRQAGPRCGQGIAEELLSLAGVGRAVSAARPSD